MKKTKKMNRGGSAQERLDREIAANRARARARSAQDRAASQSATARRGLEAYDEDNYRKGIERTMAENVSRHRGPGIANAIQRGIARAGNAVSRLGADLTYGEREATRARYRAQADAADRAVTDTLGRKKGGSVKSMKKGGKVRGDGICQRGKTKGRFV